LEPHGSGVLNLSKGVQFLREIAYSEHSFGENVEIPDLVNVSGEERTRYLSLFIYA
jgi:hypothetical protein